MLLLQTRCLQCRSRTIFLFFVQVVIALFAETLMLTCTKSGMLRAGAKLRVCHFMGLRRSYCLCSLGLGPSWRNASKRSHSFRMRHRCIFMQDAPARRATSHVGESYSMLMANVIRSFV